LIYYQPAKKIWREEGANTIFYVSEQTQQGRKATRVAPEGVLTINHTDVAVRGKERINRKRKSGQGEHTEK